jgi:succinoglycan biosynthesis transport protein ExoP
MNAHGKADLPEGAHEAPLFSLSDIFAIFLRRLRLILGVTLLGILAAIILAMSLDKLYTARVTLLVDPRQNNIVDVESVLSGMGTDNAAIASEVELLRSRSIAVRVVNEMGLDRDPEFAGGPSFVGAIRTSVFETLGITSTEAVAEPADSVNSSVVDAVMDRFSANRRGSTYVIEASFISQSPEKAAKIANAFANAYLIDQLEAKFEATRRANTWLNERVNELQERVRLAENAVERFKSENNLVDAAGLTLGEQQISQLNEQLILARAKAAESKARVDQIERVIAEGGNPANFADSLQSNVIADLRLKYADIAREEAELSSKYGSRHPSVINVRAQLSDINRQIRDEVDRIVDGARNEYDVALSRARSIEESLDELKTQFSTSNTEAIELRQLEREAQANRTLYESFLNRFKETQQQESLQTADTRIIAEALPPSFASYPKRSVIVVLAAILSLGLGVVLAFVLEFLDSTIRTRETLEETTGVSQLAAVPHIEGTRSEKRQSRRKLQKLFAKNKAFKKSPVASQKDLENAVALSTLVLDKPLSKYTESIRAFRMGLKYLSIDDPAKVIMMTSALPSEGKSTLAVNLARYAASSGEKVLLVDADLRHPVLTNVMQASMQSGQGLGLVDVLTGQATLDDIVMKDEASGLYFVNGAVSNTIPQTAEILASEKMRLILEEARGLFDLVIVDSAPLLPVVDSRAMIGSVDGVVLVVGWGRTEKQAIRSALIETPGLTDKLIGAVLNDVDLNSMRHYEYYKSNAYMKSYPYYYSQ